MRRLAIAVVSAAIAALAAAGCSSTAKPKATAPPLPSSMTVTESSNGQVFTLQHPELKAGLVTFTLTSNENPNNSGSFDMQIFALKPGATLTEFRTELAAVGAGSNGPPTAASLKLAATTVTKINNQVLAYGGNPGTSATEQQVILPAGTYYVADTTQWPKSGGKNGISAPFTVTGSDTGAVLPASSETISMTMPQMDTPRFAISAATLNPGWVRMDNTSTDLHEAQMLPVKAGATVAQVQAALESNSNTPPAVFADAPHGLPTGVDVISPHSQVNIMLTGTASEYTVVCFIPDPTTGKPHFAMGMVGFFTLGK